MKNIQVMVLTRLSLTPVFDLSDYCMGFVIKVFALHIEL